MGFELKFANKDKTFNEGCWILDYQFLKEIQSQLETLEDKDLHTDIESIEAILLIASGETELLRQRLKELEDC